MASSTILARSALSAVSSAASSPARRAGFAPALPSRAGKSSIGNAASSGRSAAVRPVAALATDSSKPAVVKVSLFRWV